jgi:hypothetical protein
MKTTGAATLLILVLLGNLGYAQIFSEDFSSFYLSEGVGGQSGNGIETDCDNPLPNCSTQADTDLDVFAWGWVEGWESGGLHGAHAVNLNTFTGDPNYAIQLFAGNQLNPATGEPKANDAAVMIWHDNVITLSSGILNSNNAGETYTLQFDASPAVYQAPDQMTTVDDGLLIEVLRSDNVVLASHEHLPGSWAGEIAFVSDAFQYTGDGSGDIRLRVGPLNFGSGHFAGAIDNLKLTGNAELFSDGFDDFSAPPQNFNGLQFESGLPVAHSGDLPNWFKEGGGTVHMVDVDPQPVDPIEGVSSNTNTLTLVEGIDANEAGATYQLSARIGPSLWSGPSEATMEDDFITIELLRQDDTVLASFEARPEPWEVGNPDAQDLDGDGTLDTPVDFEYTGDGSGPVRIRIFGETQGSSRFGGAIDDLTITRGSLMGDYNGSGALDPRDIDFLTAAVGSDDLTFDANGDGSVTSDDRTTWVEQLANTWFGDANVDGEFNSSDLVTVFTAGKYELDEFASWEQGDWNGDQRFGSGDLVTAFAGGGYETGPRNGVAAVPEPSAAVMLGIGLLVIFRRRS